MFALESRICSLSLLLRYYSRVNSDSLKRNPCPFTGKHLGVFPNETLGRQLVESRPWLSLWTWGEKLVKHHSKPMELCHSSILWREDFCRKIIRKHRDTKFCASYLFQYRIKIEEVNSSSFYSCGPILSNNAYNVSNITVNITALSQLNRSIQVTKRTGRITIPNSITLQR